MDALLRRRSMMGGAGVGTARGLDEVELNKAKADYLKSLVQFGVCEQASGASSATPKDIYINNGKLVGSKNLANFNADTVSIGYYVVKGTGEVAESSTNFMSGYIPVVGGEYYAAYGTEIADPTNYSDYNRVAWYDSSKTWISGSDYTQNRPSIVQAPANAAYAIFSCNPTGIPAGSGGDVTAETLAAYNWVFIKSNDVVDYVPYGQISVVGTAETITVVNNPNVPTERIAAYIDSTGAWRRSPDSYSICFEGEKNTSYTIKIASTDSSVVGDIFRYGLSTVDTPAEGPDYTMLTDFNRTTPQDVSEVTLTTGNAYYYIVIQCKAANAEGFLANLSISTVMDTATAPNLFSTGVISDEVDLVKGTIKHKTKAVVYDGTQEINPTYISETGGLDILSVIVAPATTVKRGEVVNATCETADDVLSCVVGIAPKQSGSGYAEPDNARPFIIVTEGAAIYGSSADAMNSSAPFNIPADTEFISGRVNVCTGAVDKTWVLVDGGDLTWEKAGNQYIFWSFAAQIPNIRIAGDTNEIEAMCDIYTGWRRSDETVYNYVIRGAEISGQRAFVYIKDSTRFSMTTTEFKEFMRGHKIAIKLRTPVASEITPSTFKTSVGANYVSSTGDSVVVEFPQYTVEQISPQQIAVGAGNNTITVDAEVDNVPIVVKYKKR